MRKGLQFQTKLMLSFVATIAVATIALIAVTEAQVKQAYTRQFSRDFKHLVNQLDRSRIERSQEFMELCHNLASQPYIISALSGEAVQEDSHSFWRFYVSSLYNLGDSAEKRTDAPLKRFSPTQEILSRMGSIGIVNRDGEITSLTPQFAGANSKEPDKKHLTESRPRGGPNAVNKAKKRIDELLASGRQETLYLPFDSSTGSGYVQEMVSTPVKRPGSDEVIGLFLRATPAESEAQRFLERYQEQFDSSAPLLSGILLDGQLYSRNLDPDLASLMAEEINERIATQRQDPGTKTVQFDTDLAGAPYRIYLARLTDEFSDDPAYQVSAFSLATLQNDLSELRIRGSGVGLIALFVGVAFAYLLSRNLAIPIRELTRATEAVKSGDLETRITVRSRDEIGELGHAFNEMADGLRQRAVYREILGKVSDETVAQAMISGELDPELGGEVKTVSVLFCDIRGFAPLTEHMAPTAVIELLNEHMTAMTAVVRKHYGVVDKFIGDEVMAVFGALKSYGDDAHHAVNCALEMLNERERLNQGMKNPLAIGIGVATGEVVAGCMGSVDRLNYTVLGSRVNLASRLCSEAGSMEVVIDEQTLSGLGPNRVESELIPELRLKGFSESITAHRLKDRKAALVS